MLELLERRVREAGRGVAPQRVKPVQTSGPQHPREPAQVSLAQRQQPRDRVAQQDRQGHRGEERREHFEPVEGRGEAPRRVVQHRDARVERGDILRRRAGPQPGVQRVPREDCVWSAMPALSAYYGGFETRFRRLPRGLAAGPESRARLAGCRYVLVSYLNTGEDFGPLYPAPEIRTFSKPLLVSSMDWNGQDTVAAALFQLLPDAGQAQPPARRAP